jgi:hypothetical protein
MPITDAIGASNMTTIQDICQVVDEAIGQAVAAVSALKAEPCHETAHDVCFELRRATHEYYFAFREVGEDASNRIEELTQALADAEIILASTTKLQSDEYLPKYLKSIRWRRDFLDALLADKTDDVRRLLGMRVD